MSDQVDFKGIARPDGQLVKYVKDKHGATFEVNADQFDGVVKDGYTPVSREESYALAADKEKKATTEGAGSRNLETGIEGALRGASDMVTSIPRAAGGLAEAAIGQNAFSDATQSLNTDNVMAGLNSARTQLQTGGPSAPGGEAQYLKEMHERADANPLANAAGHLAGGAAGLAAGGLGAAGEAASAGLGGGLLGTAAEGAAIGATDAVASATDDAHFENSHLTGAKAAFAAGLGGLLGGTLNLAGRKAGEWLGGRPAARAEAAELKRLGGSRIDDLVVPERAAPSPIAEARPVGEPHPDLAPAAKAEKPETTWAEHLANRVKKSEDGLGDDLPGFERRPEDLAGFQNRHGTPDDPHIADFRNELRQVDKVHTNRSNMVNQVLEHPLGMNAQPEWLESMTPKQREDFMHMTLGEEHAPSETTWETLVQAVREREGIAGAGPTTPPTPQAVGEELPKVIVPEAEPQMALGEGKPYDPSSLMGPSGPTSTDVIGESAAGKPVGWGKGRPAASSDEEAAPVLDKKGFFDALKSFGGRKVAGMAVRTAMRGIGAGGGIPGYLATEAVIQGVPKLGKLAKMGASGTSWALEQALRGGEKLAPYAPDGIRQQTGGDVYDFFNKKDKTPEEAFKARTNELLALKAENNAGIIDQVSKAFGDSAHAEQGAVMAMTETAIRGVDYLLAHMPKQDPNPNALSLTPQSEQRVPMRSDINDFAQVYGAVMHPHETVIHDIAMGTVTAGQISAIKDVYPQMYEQEILAPLQKKLQARDAANEPILPYERKIIDTIMGAQSGVDSEKFVDHYGPLFQKALVAQAQGDKPSPASPHKSQLASSQQSGTASILSPNKKP